MLTLSSPAQNFYTITQTPGTESLQSLCVKRAEMCDARGKRTTDMQRVSTSMIQPLRINPQ